MSATAHLVLASSLASAALLVTGDRPGRARLRSLVGSGGAGQRVEPPPLRRSWIVTGAVAAGVLGTVLAGLGAGVVLAGSAAVAGVVTARVAKARTGAVRATASELAAGWELVAVGLEAGLPVALAVSSAAEPIVGGTGDRLRRVGGLLELGADPAQAWRDAEQDTDLATFARAASRSAATGAALAEVARAEADRLRSALTDAAQERAQRAAVLITGPLGLCFLPAFLALGIAPVVVGLAGEALAQW
jgi:Flp pilus assembly protein TadB